MSKISTAEEVLLNTLNDMHEGNLADYLKNNPKELKEYSKPILEWGKSLVQAALEAAYENVEINDYDEHEQYSPHVDKDSILNAYSLENIK